MGKADIVLVDIFDNKIGMSTKQEAHRTRKLHRAFSIFLYHNDQMLIQKRALCKYHSGGLWSNACCSHPPTDKIALSHFVQQRMYEELKIICPVEEVFQFIYFHQFNEELFEYEYDHVFIGDYEGDFRLNEEEVSDAKWISLNELTSLLTEQPQLFTIWCLIAMPKVMAIIKEKKR